MEYFIAAQLGLSYMWFKNRALPPLPPKAADLTANRMPTQDHDLAKNLVNLMRKHNREHDGQAVWFTVAEIKTHRRFERFGETEVRECLWNVCRKGHKRFECCWSRDEEHRVISEWYRTRPQEITNRFGQ